MNNDFMELLTLLFLILDCMKKLIFVIALAILGWVASVNASPCPRLPNVPCEGGPSRGFNVTTQRVEMIPQCFPWILASDYFVMNIAEMYNNQNACRAQRKIDFGI